MEIPLKADVFCTDGRIGRSTNVILNPITEVITHVVVRLHARPHTEYLVSTKLVSETTPTSINLRCSSQQLQKEQPFLETEFIPVQIQHYTNAFVWPVATPETKMAKYQHHHIPLNEMAVQRGARVIALDGEVGTIDEFLANSDGQITHLVLRTGHLWGQKDISIPVSAIAHFGSQKVELNINKAQIKDLPLIAIHH